MADTADLKTGAWPFIQAVTDFLFLHDKPEAADVILIPGSRHTGHTRRAAELFGQGFAPLVLPSGRFPLSSGAFAGVLPEDQADYPQSYLTEWAFMRDVLMHHGVPEKAILREDQATFTWDNARKSAQVLLNHGVSVKKAILCCRPFHARRALLYYQTAFPETQFLVCPGQETGVDRDDWYQTAQGRARILGELQRLGGQINEQFEALCAATPDLAEFQ